MFRNASLFTLMLLFLLTACQKNEVENIQNENNILIAAHEDFQGSNSSVEEDEPCEEILDPLVPFYLSLEEIHNFDSGSNVVMTYIPNENYIGACDLESATIEWEAYSLSDFGADESDVASADEPDLMSTGETFSIATDAWQVTCIVSFEGCSDFSVSFCLEGTALIPCSDEELDYSSCDPDNPIEPSTFSLILPNRTTGGRG